MTKIIMIQIKKILFKYLFQKSPLPQKKQQIKNQMKQIIIKIIVQIIIKEMKTILDVVYLREVF